MRLDLRVRPDPVLRDKLWMSPTPYGCADCGRWFQFAGQLVQHVCEEREPVTRGPGCNNPRWENSDG